MLPWTPVTWRNHKGVAIETEGKESDIDLYYVTVYGGMATSSNIHYMHPHDNIVVAMSTLYVVMITPPLFRCHGDTNTACACVVGFRVYERSFRGVLWVGMSLSWRPGGVQQDDRVVRLRVHGGMDGRQLSARCWDVSYYSPSSPYYYVCVRHTTNTCGGG